jgi:hypothetical protein
VQVQAVVQVSHPVVLEKIRGGERVASLVSEYVMADTPLYFAHGHINGHHYRVPLRQLEEGPSSTPLLAYFADRTENTVHFGDLVVFVVDKCTDTNYAVIARRRVVKLSIDPFYVCVCEPSDVCPFVLVPVCNMVCACSEMLLTHATSPVHFVLFHQLSGALHDFA